MLRNSAPILIAEDSPTQAEQLRSVLEDNGFKVVAGRNGKEALELARKIRPSVIVSDVVMPEMDGYELCRAVKADDELCDAGIILVTELSSPHDVFKGLEAGADNFLVKPYEESHLVARIGYLLANKRLRDSRSHELGIEIQLAGKRHLITSDRQQILDLLISTYDQAVVLNERLESRQIELARSNETLNALYDLAGGLNWCGAESEVTTFAVQRALHIPGVRAGWLFLREEDGFRIAAQSGPVNAEAIAGACAECTCQRRLEAELAEPENVASCERLGGTCGHVSIPLFVDGEAVGILNLISAAPDGTFSEPERRTLATIGHQLSIAMERARLHAALERKVEERTHALQAEVIERTLAEQTARTAGDRLADAIESISDGFALFDSDERLLLHNRRYREMNEPVAPSLASGMKLEDLLQQGLEHKPGEEPTPRTVAEKIGRYRATDGQPHIQQHGNTWVMTNVQRTREGGIVVIHTDITDLKKADIAKDEFLATVSHELRTPLTSIQAGLSLICTGRFGKLSEPIENLLGLAQRNGLRLLSIVDDLLDVTRMSGGTFRLKPEMTQIDPILEQVVQSKWIGSEAPEIRLLVDDGAKGVVVEADPHRIQQVIDNFLSNAIKFGDYESPVRVVAERNGDMLRIAVSDRGPGIPKGFQPHVFKPFRQADSSSTRLQGGVGLGLNIAKAIVEAHGGTIGFTSEEGEGTTFFFELPIVANAGEPSSDTRQVA